jgi:AcrR family transcriptional regulator
MAKPSSPRGAARQRVLDASLELFALHGVSGTSLQMIAARIGVTKAAVYFQFRTKEEIVAALLEEPLCALARVLDDAERETRRVRRVEVTLQGLVGVVLANRRGTAMLIRDPGAALALKQIEAFTVVGERLESLLLGSRTTREDRVSFAVLMGGLMQVGVSPYLEDLDDVTLRRILIRVGGRLLGVDDEAGARQN